MKGLEDAFNLAPLPYVQDMNILADDEKRETPQEVIDTAKEHIEAARAMALTAAEDMLLIAQTTQNPKAYEVLNTSIKTYADISMTPVDLEIKKTKIIEQPKDTGDRSVVNQNLFVGSTAELLKIIDNMGKPTSA